MAITYFFSARLAICVSIILLMLAGCQITEVPTPTVPPTDSPTAPPRLLNPQNGTRSYSPVITQTPEPSSTPLPSLTPTIAPATPEPFVENTTLRVGESAQGREIIARRFGDGNAIIMLVGGIHGGWEANTVLLMGALIEHFENTPDDVLPGFSIVIIPSMNPDGLAVGQSLEGRFNSNGVDLNRNWACGWQPEAVWREGPVDPGDAPMSEPETQAMAAYIRTLQPEVVLFYHSAADGIFAGNCPDRREIEWRSGQLEAVYGEAAGYSYGEAFSAYPVTGTGPNWVDGLGIASVDVELSSARETQFARNLDGVMATQCWLLGINAAITPQCQ